MINLGIDIDDTINSCVNTAVWLYTEKVGFGIINKYYDRAMPKPTGDWFTDLAKPIMDNYDPLIKDSLGRNIHQKFIHNEL